jgi:hypothetical protein
VAGINSQFEHELKTIIAAEVDRIKDILAAGTPIKDYADYRFHAGQLNALKRVVDNYFPETNDIIQKR